MVNEMRENVVKDKSLGLRKSGLSFNQYLCEAKKGVCAFLILMVNWWLVNSYGDWKSML